MKATRPRRQYGKPIRPSKNGSRPSQLGPGHGELTQAEARFPPGQRRDHAGVFPAVVVFPGAVVGVAYAQGVDGLVGDPVPLAKPVQDLRRIPEAAAVDGGQGRQGFLDAQFQVTLRLGLAQAVRRKSVLGEPRNAHIRCQ